MQSILLKKKGQREPTFNSSSFVKVCGISELFIYLNLMVKNRSSAMVFLILESCIKFSLISVVIFYYVINKLIILVPVPY
jgi:hypothetical protein